MPNKTSQTLLSGRGVSSTLTRRLMLMATAAAALAFGAGHARADVNSFRRRAMKRHQENRKAASEGEGKTWLDRLIGDEEDDESPETPVTQKPETTPTAHPTLLKAAVACVTTGEAARSVSERLVREGNADLAATLKALRAMVPVSAALGELAKIDAARLKPMARLSIGFLDDAAKECIAHAGAQPEFKACAAACAYAIRQCRTVTA